MDTLQGVKENKKIADAGLLRLPEFGSLKKIPRDELRMIAEWMIEHHFMLRTRGRYPVLHPTYEGMHYSEAMTEGKLKALKGYLLENRPLMTE